MRKNLLLLCFIALLSFNQVAAQTGLSFTTAQSTQVASIPHSTVYDFGIGGFTFEATVNIPSTFTGNGTIFSSRTFVSGTSSDGILILSSGTTMLLLQVQGTVGGNYTLNTGINHRDGNCHSLVITRNEANLVTLYVDGAKADEITIGSKNIVRANALPLKIGQDITSGSILGSISEVRLWNIARTAQQVASTYNKALAGNELGLVGYWPLNEGSGQTAADLSSNGNDAFLGTSEGIDSADPTWGDGCSYEPISDKEPHMIAFSGNQVVSIPSSTVFDLGTSAFVFEATINIPGGSSPGTIFSSRTFVSGTTADGMLILASTSTSILVQLQGTVGGNFTFITPINYFDGKCHHIAVKRDAFGVLGCYFDGTLVSERAISEKNIVRASDSAVQLGQDLNGLNKLTGKITEVRLWNTALSNAVIKENAGRTLTGKETGLIGYWRCDDGEGQVVTDYSSNNLHAVFGKDSTTESSDPLWDDKCGTVTALSAGELNAIDFLLYPNPTNDILAIGGENITQIRLLNAQGMELMSIASKEGINTINVAYLNEGMYIVVATINGTQISRHFVKQ